MSTRCSIIVRKNNDAFYVGSTGPRSPRTEKGINGRECFQFYHHHDGYISGVGEEIFEFFREGIKNDSLSLRELPGSYEPEEFGSIHGDWEYLYLIDCKGDVVEFFVSREPRLVRFFVERNESENSGEEDLDTMLSGADNFRLYASISLRDHPTAVTSLKKPVNAGDFFIHITDGNHRLQALKEMGYTHAPVILLYPEEYRQIAQQKIGIDYLVQRTGYILTDRTKLTSSIFIQKWLTNQLKW